MRRLLRWIGALLWLVVLGVGCVAVAYSSFNLVVRRGAVATPDLTGVALKDASDRLQDLGLRVRHDRTTDRPHPSIGPGMVVEQRPPAGARIKRGGRVDLVVSTGADATPVPDVVGAELQAALVALAAAGVEPGSTLRVTSPDQPAGRVVESIPPAGAAIGPSTKVTLVVSEGAREQTWLMPHLISRSYAEVRAGLEQQGFRFGRVTFERYEGIAAGTVLRQYPLAGHPLRRSEAISLAVVADPDGLLAGP
jgi:serine/threonine-protein kinase